MATTTTTNLKLVKPDYSEAADVAVLNQNADKIDAAISAAQSGLAIICNGNTHAAIASGQYAYVRNHSSLAEGLYQATTAIAANATLSSSNLSAVPNGGLNELNSNFTTIRTAYSPLITSTNNPNFEVSNSEFFYIRLGKALFLNGRFNIVNAGDDANSKNVVIPLPSGMTCGDGVGAVGWLSVNKTGVDLSRLSIRQAAPSSIYIQVGAGGNGSCGILGAGFVLVQAVVFIR